MLLSHTTTTGLLKRLLEPESYEAWQELDRRYRPIIRGFARQFALARRDAEEVADETLGRFARSPHRGAGNLRPAAKGRGRELREIALSCIREVLEAGRSADLDIGRATACDAMRVEAIWTGVCHRLIKETALEEMRRRSGLDDRSVQAFEWVVLEQRVPVEVAAELRLSVSSVYAAKHRCAVLLRKITAELRHLYELQ